MSRALTSHIRINDVLRDHPLVIFLKTIIWAGYRSIFFETIFVSIQNDRYSIYHLISMQDKKIRICYMAVTK